MFKWFSKFKFKTVGSKEVVITLRSRLFISHSQDKKCVIYLQRNGFGWERVVITGLTDYEFDHLPVNWKEQAILMFFS